MLPSLSGLNLHALRCQPCNAVLDKWEDRDDLPEEKLARIPPSYNEPRTECAICYQELRHDNDGEETGDKRVLAIVDFEGACGHSFHISCLSHWLDARQPYDETLKCPVCNRPVMDEWVDTTYNRLMGARRPAEPRPQRARWERDPDVPVDLRDPIVVVLADGVPTWRQTWAALVVELRRQRDEFYEEVNRLREAWQRDTERREQMQPEMRRMREEGFSWIQVIEALLTERDPGLARRPPRPPRAPR